MTFLAEVESAFVDLAEWYEDFYIETFDNHLGSGDLSATYIKSLRKLTVTCDASDIRSPLNEDFNPGPFVLIGVPIQFGENFYSLIPGLGSAMGGNTTSMLGVVTGSQNFSDPNHVMGYTEALKRNPQMIPFPATWEKTALLGDFVAPTELKGYVPELSKSIVGSYLEFLSYAFGMAVLSAGLNAFEKERGKVEALVKKTWKLYLDEIETALSE